MTDVAPQSEAQESLSSIYIRLNELLGQAPPQDGHYMHRDEFMGPQDLQPTHTNSNMGSARNFPSSEIGQDLFSVWGNKDRRVWLQAISPVYFQLSTEVQKGRMDKTYYQIVGNYANEKNDVISKHFVLAPNGETWLYETWVNKDGRPGGKVLTEKPSLDFWKKVLTVAEKTPGLTEVNKG